MSPPPSCNPGVTPLSSELVSALALTLPAEWLDAVADRVAERVLARLEAARRPAEPWLDVGAAAEYLACPTSRIYDLVALERLRCAKDGRRSLFRAEWLDEALEATGP